MLQKSGRLVLWEAMFILELHSAETQEAFLEYLSILKKIFRVCLFHFGSDHANGAGKTFHPESTAFPGYFAVRMYP